MHPRTRRKAKGAGLCPNCGQSVPRWRTATDERSADVYDCPDCGRFTYTSEGPDLPLVVPRC